MRKAVVEVRCARCERVEYRPFVEGKPEENTVFMATIMRGDKILKQVKFDDLCIPCMRTVGRLLDGIGKQIEGVSPIREAKKEPPQPELSQAPKPAPAMPVQQPGVVVPQR